MAFYKGNIPWSKGKKFVEQKIELIFCSCDCGEKFNKFDNRNRPRKFIKGHNSREYLNFNWKGGISTHQYISLRIKKGEYKRQHRIVMENFLGRRLTTDEHVHHINHNKFDNSIKNLIVLTNSEHGKLHMKERAKVNGRLV